MLSPSPESAFAVRVLHDGKSPRCPAGAGFLVTPQHVVTCAHVVNEALGRKQNAADSPSLPILLDFPLLHGQPSAQAKLLRWFPVKADASFGELEDIAILELLPDSLLPVAAQPAPLVLLDGDGRQLSGQQVRMYGFSVPDGTYANGILQGLTAKGWAEIHHADSGSVDRGFSGAAVWSVRQNAVCGMIVSMLSSAASYMIPAAALIQAFPELDKCSRPANPYRGMEAFREKDARFYFGREADAATLKEKIEKQPFTSVIGASGSGKSSLVFAGLLPLLRQDGGWLCADCKPRHQPFVELAGCLVPFLYEDELERVKKSRQCAADLLAGALLLSDLLRRIATRNEHRRFLLIVDQFEELFTLNADSGLRQRFIASLLDAADAEGAAVLLTMRADFLEAALGDPCFAKKLNDCPPLLLAPMGGAELKQAAEQPAELLGVRFEPGLTDLLVAELNSEPGSLPLLEFCLTQLWERQEFRQISHAACNAIGGVRGALSGHADKVLVEFDREEVRRIFLRLVRPGWGTEDTRQVAALAEFQEEQRGLIRQLASRRLLVTSGDEGGQRVEVAHEALIRHWRTLKGWVDEDREFLVWRDKLRILLRQWQESDHDEGALLRGLPLDEALQWRESHAGHLGEDELEFLAASKQASDRYQELEEVAEELEKNKDLLVEAERYAAIGQVIAQLTHNVRNPVTAIGGTARLLTSKISDPQQLNFLAMMINAVEKVEQTVEDLLSFVDTEPSVKERVLLYPLIIKSLMLFHCVLKKQQIEYDIIMPDRQLEFEMDPLKIKRVFVHLIRNAVESMENGGKLVIKVDIVKEKIKIFIRDRGVGIAESDIHRVTDLLYTTKLERMGLGLSSVERIVLRHNGKLTIRRRNSGGTEVEITLPL